MGKLSFKTILRNRTAKSGFASGVFSTCFSLLWGGLAMTGYINPSLGWVLACVGLVGMLVSTFIFLSGKNNVYRELLVKEKGLELKEIPTTLTSMHQRIRQLRAELTKKDINRDKVARLQEKMHKTIPVSQWVIKRIQGMQKSGNEAGFIRAVEILHRLTGSVYSSTYEAQICDVGGMLETEDVGLKPILSTDPEYTQLKDELEMQYAGTPRSISKRILKYEHYLYGISSVILWNNYRTKYLGKQLPTVVEARVVQFEGHSEDEIMNKLKEDVASAISKYME